MTTSTSWRCDPYLWVHLAGMATVPLWLSLCLLGLAAGNPTLPTLELGLLMALGIAPVLVMQLRRPFNIFCLPGLVLRPTALSDDQRRLLRMFRHSWVRLGAVVAAVLLGWVLIQLYPIAFLSRDLTPFASWGRLGGLAVAGFSFLMANLFVQVPVAVLLVLATPQRRMAAAVPYPVEAVAADFFALGLPVGRLLPAIAAVSPPAPAPPMPAQSPDSAQATPPIELPEPQGEGDPLRQRLDGEPMDPDRLELVHSDTDGQPEADGYQTTDLLTQVIPDLDTASAEGLVPQAIAPPPHPECTHPNLHNPPAEAAPQPVDVYSSR